MKKKFIFYSMIFFLTTPLILFAQESSCKSQNLAKIIFFYSESCHNCQKVKHEIMPFIDQEFSGRLDIEYRDIADINNYKLLLSLKEKYGYAQKINVPIIFVKGRFLIGYDQINKELRSAIISSLGKNKFEKLNNLPTVDLIKHFLSFGIFAVLAAGLIDGINPCAFTVIVFFISFLAFQGYKKRELAAIGLSFICAVFLTYILIGLGLFRFLYSLHKFYLVTRIVYYFIAVLCFILGALAIYDIWIFLKTRQTDGLTLQLPQVVKNRIHSIIGMYYRKSPQEKLHVGSQRHFMRLVASAFLTGFLVSLLEAVCTGQLYLPTITLILKEASLRLRAFGYLLLYNFMFIIPLGLVLVFALLGTTSEGFARVMKKNIVVVKLLMALLFLGLGLVILKGI